MRGFISAAGALRSGWYDLHGRNERRTNNMVDAATTAKLAALEATVASLTGKLNKRSTLRLKVGEKGGVCLMGINVRFPVTLYYQQWERLLNFKDEILTFIEENKANLASKD